MLVEATRSASHPDGTLQCGRVDNARRRDADADCAYHRRLDPHSTSPLMTISMHAASVPVFRQMLGSLGALLDKAQAHAEARNFDAGVLLQARLFPDMFPLVRQVQIACDFAKGVTARLAGAEVPVYDDKEQSFEELRALVDRTIAFVGSFDADAFTGSEGREIVTRPGTPKELETQKTLPQTLCLLQVHLPPPPLCRSLQCIGSIAF